MPGATDVVLHIGTNDIAAGRNGQEIVGGLVRFTGLARAAGKRVFLTTITPSDAGPHGSARAAAVRDGVNRWVRERGAEYADGVFDFAAAVADPARPGRLLGRYDSGDGLHLSPAGYRALADAVDVTRLTGSPCLADRSPSRVVLSMADAAGRGRLLPAEPPQRVAPGRRLDGDVDRQRTGFRVLLVQPFEDPVDGERAGGDAPLGGEPPQLLHAQRRQPRGKTWADPNRPVAGPPEPASGASAAM